MEKLYLQTITTPLGTLVAGCTHQGLCLLQFEDTFSLAAAEEWVKNHNYIPSMAPHTHIAATNDALKAYFAGNPQPFNIPLHLIGSDFQVRVWQQLQQIPYGKTMSYKQQAMQLGNPQAIRAIASANGANPVMMVVPCHRVVGSKGQLTGYRGGLWRKQHLLTLEGALPSAAQLAMW